MSLMKGRLEGFAVRTIAEKGIAVLSYAYAAGRCQRTLWYRWWVLLMVVLTTVSVSLWVRSERHVDEVGVRILGSYGVSYQSYLGHVELDLVSCMSPTGPRLGYGTRSFDMNSARSRDGVPIGDPRDAYVYDVVHVRPVVQFGPLELGTACLPPYVQPAWYYLRISYWLLLLCIAVSGSVPFTVRRCVRTLPVQK